MSFSRMPDLYGLRFWGKQMIEILHRIESQRIGPSVDESELRLAQLQHQLSSNDPGALMHLVEDVPGEDEEDNDTRECKKLFKDMKFFLNREVYRDSLLFIIPAFGGIVSWQGDGAPFEEDDDSITHQIIDRPRQDGKICGREYVQPQWVYDCVNARIILPTRDYLVGRKLAYNRDQGRIQPLLTAEFNLHGCFLEVWCEEFSAIWFKSFSNFGTTLHSVCICWKNVVVIRKNNMYKRNYCIPCNYFEIIE